MQDILLYLFLSVLLMFTFWCWRMWWKFNKWIAIIVPLLFIYILYLGL